MDFFNNKVHGYVTPLDLINCIDEILSRVHPNFSNLRESTLKLHRRNVLQILGQDLATPSHLFYVIPGTELKLLLLLKLEELELL